MDNNLKDAFTQILSTREGYDIATALRGPDVSADEDYNSILKYSTASVIRHHVGIGEDNVGGCVVNPDSQELCDYRKGLGKVVPDRYSHCGTVIGVHDYKLAHYVGHAYRAFMALGLKWDEVNEGQGDKWSGSF